MVRRPPPTDRDKVKIASFRISEGEWFDFSEEADRQNVTATDVIKGSIRLFMAGTLELPEPIEPQHESSSQFGDFEDVKRFVSTAVDTAIGKLSILGINRVTEIARGEVERGLLPVNDDLVTLQSQLTEALDIIKGASVTTHTDVDPAAIQIYIDQQIEGLRAELTAIGAKPTPLDKPTKKPVATGGQSTAQETEIRKWVNRLESNPGLRAAIESGLDQGLTGKGLTEWVFDKGHGVNDNTKPFDPSVGSRMRGAIEYLNGVEK